jgi:hypothetical protein
MLIDGGQLPQPPSSSGRSLNVVCPQAPQNCDLQSPCNWGSRAPRSGSSATTAILFSALIIGEAAQLVPRSATPSSRGTPFSPLIIGEAAQPIGEYVFCHNDRLQSPHHRGSRSTVPGSGCGSPRTSVPPSSGKPLNAAPSLNSTRSSTPFSPLIIGEAAQPHDQLRGHRRRHWPSVPSSSGKPLNSGLQKASSGAAFRRGFEVEEPAETHTPTGHLSGPSRL